MTDGITAMFEDDEGVIPKTREEAMGGSEDADYLVPISSTQQKISDVCDNIKEMLIDKNRKYGNSALNPIRVFSKSDRIEQIKVRIDDKLNRLRNMQPDEEEDTVVDLIGYLILYKVAIG